MTPKYVLLVTICCLYQGFFPSESLTFWAGELSVTQGCFVHCRTFSSIPWCLLLNSSDSPLLGQPKLSDIARFSLVAKPPLKTTVLEAYNESELGKLYLGQDNC